MARHLILFVTLLIGSVAVHSQTCPQTRTFTTWEQVALELNKFKAGYEINNANAICFQTTTTDISSRITEASLVIRGEAPPVTLTMTRDGETSQVFGLGIKIAVKVPVAAGSLAIEIQTSPSSQLGPSSPTGRVNILAAGDLELTDSLIGRVAVAGAPIKYTLKLKSTIPGYEKLKWAASIFFIRETESLCGSAAGCSIDKASQDAEGPYEPSITASAAGTYRVQFTVTDTVKTRQFEEFVQIVADTKSLTIDAPLFHVPLFTVGRSVGNIQFKINTLDAKLSARWSADPSLPAGLSIDPGTGIVSGTITNPALAGRPFSATIKASVGGLDLQAYGYNGYVRPVENALAGLKSEIESTITKTYGGDPLNISLAFKGYEGVSQLWSLSAGGCKGLSLVNHTFLSPTLVRTTQPAGNCSFTVTLKLTVLNVVPSIEIVDSIEVSATVNASADVPAKLSSGYVDRPYLQELGNSGNKVEVNVLPSGLNLVGGVENGWSISGTPTVATEVPLTVTFMVTGESGSSVSKESVITIEPKVVLTLTSNPAAEKLTPGTSIEMTVQAKGILKEAIQIGYTPLYRLDSTIVATWCSKYLPNRTSCNEVGLDARPGKEDLQALVDPKATLSTAGDITHGLAGTYEYYVYLRDRPASSTRFGPLDLAPIKKTVDPALIFTGCNFSLSANAVTIKGLEGWATTLSLTNIVVTLSAPSDVTLTGNPVSIPVGNTALRTWYLGPNSPKDDLKSDGKFSLGDIVIGPLTLTNGATTSGMTVAVSGTGDGGLSAPQIQCKLEI